ncbi:amidohydrolase family protein [Akkermansiaceae bacterium]|nr:amidohydrolase family protein [Akkermansiaceae bacterium]
MSRKIQPAASSIALLLSLQCALPLHAGEAPFFTPEKDRKGMQGGLPTDPKLPNVLILGDSISIGYTPAVRDGLKGRANLIRPKENCGDTRMGLAGIDKWLGDTKWDVIHFNWGLWDLCYRNPESNSQGKRDKANGTISIPIPAYEKNLESLVTRLKQTGATLIWANTTLVPEHEVGRVAGDELRYNAAAARIMEKHGVRINDLRALTGTFGKEMFSGPGDVHYTAAGSAKLAEQVVAEISKALHNGGVIDTHVHLYDLARPEGVGWIPKDNEKLYRNHLPADHEPIAKANGVTGVVLVQAGQSLPDNQWNLDITAHNKSLYRGVVGNLSQVIGTDAFLPLFGKLCQDPRYLGYRLSGRNGRSMDGAFFRDLKLTAEAGKSVDFLLGDYTLRDVATVARRMPSLRIIVDHFGGVRLDGKPLPEEWIAEFRAVAEFPNVHCKVSALYGRVAEQPAPTDLAFYKPVLDLAFDAFGEHRLIYGSDWPVTKTTGDYASVLRLTREYFQPKGPAICDKLFRLNAEKFYAIPPME